MLGHGGSSAGSYLADPTSPPLALCCNYPVSKCCSASIVATSTVAVNDIAMASGMSTTLNEVKRACLSYWYTALFIILTLKVLVTTIDVLGHFETG